MTTITYTDTLSKHHITLPDPDLADLEVPVLTGPQRQGDVGIWPRPPAGPAQLADMVKVPAAGIPVVRGETSTGGNAHILDAYHGDVYWQPIDRPHDGITLGVLHIPDGSVAYLTHTDEHGCNGIGPGTYRLTGKREQAEMVRRVAD